MMERTAAVVANLSGMMDTYAPLRESGIVQKLVKLLEHGTPRNTQQADRQCCPILTNAPCVLVVYVLS